MEVPSFVLGLIAIDDCIARIVLYPRSYTHSPGFHKRILPRGHVQKPSEIALRSNKQDRTVLTREMGGPYAIQIIFLEVETGLCLSHGELVMQAR